MIKDELLKIKEEALKAISDIDNMENLNNLRVNYLGKKGVLTNILKSLKDIPNSTLRENDLAVVDIRLVAQSETDRSLY